MKGHNLVGGVPAIDATSWGAVLPQKVKQGFIFYIPQ